MNPGPTGGCMPDDIIETSYDALDIYAVLILHPPLPARVAELVDARDLKSLGTWCRAGSIPAPGTQLMKHAIITLFL